MLALLLLIVPLCPLALAAPSQILLHDAFEAQVSAPDPLPDPSHLIFASFVGLLKQWPNTYYPNGHSVVLGTVPPGTLLYHARKDDNFPPKIEWLAFDAEMSYGIMSGRGGETQLLTYAANRPLRIIYLDGQSAALGESGWLDTQSVLIYGNVTNDRSWGFSEYARAEALCKLGDAWGFDGVVRMNAGFELLYCDFGGAGLDLQSRINVTDPYSEPGMGFPAPPDSPYILSSIISSRELRGHPPYPLQDPAGPKYPERPPHGGGSHPPGRRRPRGRPSTSPFASSSIWEWQRSSTWHYIKAERRVLLDYSTFVTFYDPVVRSLARTRLETGTDNNRAKQRLLGIDDKEAGRMSQHVREALREKNVRGWGTREAGTGVEWMSIAESIVERYGGRLEELNYAMRESNGTTSQQGQSGPRGNSTSRAVDVRRLSYFLMFPYLDMAHYSNTSTKWMNSSLPLCQNAFTRSSFVKHTHLSPNEKLLQFSIEGVLGRICSKIITIFGESLLIGLPWKLHEVSPDPEALEHRAKVATKRWREELTDLLDWLGWSVEMKCDRICAPDEICQIPVWPLVARPGGRWGGGEGKELESPVCVSFPAR
ncbi:hypothetical protein P7C70_g141, partial [Phenoliferia sp. Uapishka_3]